VLFALLLQSAPPQNPILGFLPLILIFGIFYFLVFLPMQRQKKAQQQMLSSLKNGDMVATTGGIVGSIVAIHDDDTMVLRVKPDNIKLTVTRSSVNALLNPAETKS